MLETTRVPSPSLLATTLARPQEPAFSEALALTAEMKGSRQQAADIRRTLRMLTLAELAREVKVTVCSSILTSLSSAVPRAVDQMGITKERAIPPQTTKEVKTKSHLTQLHAQRTSKTALKVAVVAV